MPRFLGEITEYLEDTEVTSPMRKVMVALSRMEPQWTEWMDRMEHWLSSIGPECNIPKVWELFLEEFKKQVTESGVCARGLFQKVPNAPQMTGTNFETYLQEFDNFLTDNAYMSDA